MTIDSSLQPLQVKLLDLPASALAALPGLGPARSCKLVAGLELAHRHLAADLARGESLRDPAAAGRYFKQRLRARPNEVFAALCLDNQHRTLACEELFSGTVDAARSTRVKWSAAPCCTTRPR